MKRSPSFTDRLNSAANALMGRRARLTVLLASLAATPVACKISLSLNTDFDRMDAVRNGALDSGNTRVISATEAGTGITLGKVEKKVQVKNEEGGTETKTEFRIGGLLYIYPHSPLRTYSGTQVYRLPEDAAPWTFLTQEKAGIITLRTKCDTLVLRFNCSNLSDPNNYHCAGEEVPPHSVRKLCADGHFCPAVNESVEQDAGAPDAPADSQDGGGDAAINDALTGDAAPDGTNQDSQADVPAENAESAKDALNEIEGLLMPATLDKVKKTAKMISEESHHSDIDAETKEQVSQRIKGWLEEHNSNGDFKTVFVVLRYLKGQTTEKDREHIKKLYKHDIPN